MSTIDEKQTRDASSVEAFVNSLTDDGIKSIVVINDVVAGIILGEVDEVDHELELAAGASYVVIGLGQLSVDFDRGINFVRVGAS